MGKIKKLVRDNVYKFLPGNRPDFLIIGVQKAGTTALHSYLNMHPSLVGSKPKETYYFTTDSKFSLGNKWYENHFKSPRALFSNALFFEATPDYIYRSYVPERIRDYDKKLKFIVILREPVSRAYSNWHIHFLRKQKDSSMRFFMEHHGFINDNEKGSYDQLYELGDVPSFEDCVYHELQKINVNSELEEPAFVRKGLYINQIERFYQYFKPEQFLFIGTRELEKDIIKTLNKVLKFLGLDDYDWDLDLLIPKNRKIYSTTMKPETKILLEQFYLPYNQKLFSKIGEK